MDLQNFKHTIAQSLLRAGKALSGRRNLGRPLCSIKTLHCLKKRHENRTDPIPENNLRKGGMHHWQEYSEKQNRCKMPGCNKKNLHPLHEMQSIFVFYERPKLFSPISYLILKKCHVEVNFTLCNSII